MKLMVMIGLLLCAHRASAQNVDVESLHKKCNVELRYQMVPTNCFLWLNRSSLNPSRKEYLKQWFSAVCKKAMKRDESQVQYHVQNMGALSSECRKDMELAFDQWSYRSKAENPEKILQLMASGRARPTNSTDALDTGKDLEYTVAHDAKKTKRSGNLRSPR